MTKTELKLSYIIPAYNEEKHIIRCLDSIYAQQIAISEYEVIVVDDCSTDATVTIVEEYAKNHTNLRIIRQTKNHKQGASRNKGIENAKGIYINFVDADDVVESGIAQAVDEALQNRVDILCARCYTVMDCDNGIRQLDAPCGVVMTSKELCEKWMTPVYIEPAWGKLFRREFLIEQNHPFVEDKQYEDSDWTAYHFYKASLVIYSDAIVYGYIDNFDSTTRKEQTFNVVVDFLSCGCRRKRVADEVRNTMPDFVETIWNTFQEEKYILLMLTWKLWTKFPIRDSLKFYKKMSAEDLEYLKNGYQKDWFSKMVLSYPIITKLFILTVIPAIQRYRIIRYGENAKVKIWDNSKIY